MKVQEFKDIVKRRLGIERLNDMQMAVLAAGKSHRLLLLSPTGSGKTLAYTGALLTRLGAPGKGTAAVVIAPSRELVVQIGEVVRAVATGYKTTTFYGGHSMRDEAASASVAPDIIVATPGRLLDHLNRGQVDLSGVSVAVLDEYDKSLELGFADEMSRIMRRVPKRATIVMTSATRVAEMPDYMTAEQPDVLDFTAEARAEGQTAVETAVVESDARDKLATATALGASLGRGERAIFFVNHRESAERVADGMRKTGLEAGLYHGALDQTDRENALEMFNNGTTPILVSTDLGSRGLDIDGGVEAIVHYHLPLQESTWTHRNGRTARMGASGRVYVITGPGESLPEWVKADGTYVPEPRADRESDAATATMYFNAGRKEKLSKGDIVGFLTKSCGLEGGEIGRIALRDHSALAAIPAAKARSVAKTAAETRIKNKRVRVTRLIPKITTEKPTK